MKKILIPFVLLALVVSSCKKDLDLRPTDAIDVTKAFTSVDDLEKGLLGAYAQAGNENRIYIGSILSDEVKLSTENRGQGQFSFKFQYSSTEAEHNSDFGKYYVVLDRLHRVLAAMDNVAANGQLESTRKAKIKAELIGLRGVALYELLIQFMPSGYDPNAKAVAIVLKSDLTAKPSRNTVGEVVAQIQSDLAAARADANLPNTAASFAAGSTDYLRLTKAAIAAYQARLSLLKRDYAAAITFASDAMTLSGRSLATGSTYVNYWADANESETIWKYRNSATPQTLWRDTNGDVYFEPSDKLKNLFNRTTDIRFNTFFGSAGNDSSIVKKYPGSALGPQINDLKMIRVSEMYLLRAEAYAESNQLTQAAADLNAVRAARITGYTPVVLATQAVAVTEILNERFRELCFEGFRFFDLKRKGLAVNRLASDVQSSTWQNLPANNYKFALPLPQDEIFANPNAVQNPGY